jgi:type IV pilus assembly protein PilY1
MVNWNATTTDTKYAVTSDATNSTTTPVSVTASNLQTQTATADSTNSTRTASNATMCWKGMTGCSNASSTPPVIADAMGWTMTLPTSTEQVIYNPLVANGMLFVNTTIPATSAALTCQSTDVAGWTMGVSVTNGGAGTVPAFDGGYSGYSLNGAGTPAIYAVGTTTFLGTNTNDHHQFKAKKTNPQPGNGSRLTWTKIR